MNPIDECLPKICLVAAANSAYAVSCDTNPSLEEGSTLGGFSEIVESYASSSSFALVCSTIAVKLN